MDLFIVAMSRYKRHKYDQTIELCNEMLSNNPDDQVLSQKKLILIKIS